MNVYQTQKQAYEYFQQSEYKKAIALYHDCIESNPYLMSNYWYLGLALLLTGEEAQAQGVWLSALTEGSVEHLDRLMAELVDLLAAEASRFLDFGKLELAERVYWQVIEASSENAEFHYLLGNAIAFQGREDEAIACWQQAVNLKPDFFDAYQSQASLFQRLQEFDRAIPCFLKAVQIKPDCYESFYNLGLCFCQVNKLDEAIKNFHYCLKIQPDYAPAWGDLGISWLRLGNFDEAIACLQKTILIAAEFVEVYCCWRDNLAEDGKDNEDINVNVNFLQTIQDLNAEAYFYLGELLARQNRLDLAMKCYKKAIEFNMDSPETYLNLSKALVTKGDVEGAIAAYQKSLDISLELTVQNYLDFGKILAQEVTENLSEIDNEEQEFFVEAPDRVYYQSTADWAVTNSLENSNFIKIDSGNFIELRPPLMPDKWVHFSFRFGNKINLPGTFVAIIPNGRYWLDEKQATSAVIASDNKVIGDISPQFPVFSPGHPDNSPSKNRIFTLKELPPFENIEGTVVVLSGILNYTYFHWMFDILPRIEFLRRAGIEVNSVDKFLINNTRHFQRETLQKLGIPERKVLESDRYHHIKATQLIVPSFPGSIAWMPKWVCDFLRKEFLPEKVIISEKIERLYISRQQASSRRIINEEEIVCLLEKLGFKSVTLESMSVAKQAELLANTKVVVSPHGGGLTNLVFCHEGTKVIEIFSPEYVYHCYWLVANLMGLEYYYVLGEIPVGFYLQELLYPNHRFEDIFVNPNQLLNVLEFAGVV